MAAPAEAVARAACRARVAAEGNGGSLSQVLGAERHARAALRASPEQHEYALGLAAVLHTTGGYDEAVELYRNLLRARPDDAQVLGDLGGALHEARRARESRDAFGRARSKLR